LEVKKLHTGKFWNGLEEQWPAYMKSDELRKGWFLAVRYRDGRRWDKRIDELCERVRKVVNQRGLNLNMQRVSNHAHGKPGRHPQGVPTVR